MTKWKSNDFLYVKLRTRLDTIHNADIISIYIIIHIEICPLHLLNLRAIAEVEAVVSLNLFLILFLEKFYQNR